MNPETDSRAKETNLYEIVDLLWRRKTLIAVCLAAVLTPIVISNFTTPPVYESQATLIFERTQDPLPSFSMSQSFYWDKSNIVNQIEEIKSRSLAGEVAAKLDPATVSALLRGREAAYSDDQRQEILTDIIRGSIAAEPVRDSDIFKVRAAGPTPPASAGVANLVAQVIIERNAMIKRQQAASTRRFIETQLPMVELQLNRTEETLKRFKSANQVVSLSDEAREILSRVTGAENQYTVAATERQALEQKLAAITDQIKSQGGNAGMEITSGSLADGMRKNLVDLEMQATQLAVKGYAPDHTQMLTLTAQIGSTKKKLAEELAKINRSASLTPMPQMENLLDQIPPLQIDLVTAHSRERALKAILSDYEADLSKLPAKELQLARLLRSKEVNENIYKLLLEKNEEAKITEAGKIGNIRIIDPARAPNVPIRPRKILNLMIGLIVGLALGVGLAFFLDSLDNSIKSAEEIEHAFRLPVLGLVPAIQAEELRKRRQNRIDEVEKIASTLVTRFAPRSPISEAYRALRTNIQFLRIDAPLKTLVISSPGPSEGKSTSVANLAITTALTGARTLLVDADLRRPVIHSLFGLEREPGMINMLVEKLPLEKVVKPSGIEHLDILTCGAIPPNPSELLGSQKMRDLIKTLSEKYDLVLFDSPPVITVTDTAVLGSQVEGVVLVALSHGTDRRAMARAQTLLANVKANVVGAVINRIKFGLSGSYSYHYHYHYYYYDSEGKPSKRRNRLLDFFR
ncbi:MAG: polysaccharide biosynthesis tyrosine autokinase [Candidatus Edwardsbacteria bacterium]|nr:polysaccharide biosynthesis tyrosine autokinase [Candidatus Edwardsbacteria bacterium]